MVGEALGEGTQKLKMYNFTEITERNTYSHKSLHEIYNIYSGLVKNNNYRVLGPYTTI